MLGFFLQVQVLSSAFFMQYLYLLGLPRNQVFSMLTAILN
nr:MAG TPA: hypothetical protein [Caudoviricetes sp.]DAQ55305.1 MAG TPA: hypothetical protein [Caudoviricetes sp.]